MQLKHLSGGLGAVLSLGLLSVAGCGEGLPSKTCAADTDCAATETCHPTAKVCVKTCTQDSDCSSNGTCGSVSGSAAKFCQCSTDASCGGGTGSTAICSTADKICATKCGSDTDCGGRHCDTATGQCQPLCSSNTDCAANQVCDSTSHQCRASTEGQTCNASNPQPDSCDNGQYCTGSSPVCTAVPAPTCGNFVGSQHGTSWVPTNDAPVIYSITSYPAADPSTFCSGGARFKAHVKAYSKTGQLGTSSATIEPQLHYVRADGSEGPTTDTTQNVTTSASGQNTEFDINFCRPTGTTTLTIGLHFMVSTVTGNEACAMLQ